MPLRLFLSKIRGTGKYLRRDFSTIIAGVILIVLSLGYFSSRELYDILHISLISIYIFSLFLSLYFTFWAKNPERKEGFLLLLLAGVNILVQGFRSVAPEVYYLNFACIAFSTAVAGFRFGVFASLVVLFIDLSSWAQEPVAGLLRAPFLNLFMNLIFTLTVGLYLLSETHEKERLENKYRNIIKNAESLVNPSYQQIETADPRLLSREERQRRLLRTSMDLDKKIHKILEVIKQSLHPYTCVLFIRANPSNRLKVKDVLSDSDDIDVENIDTNEGVLGWVLNKGTFIYLTEFNGISGIPYYTRNPGIRSFLAVPVTKQGSQTIDGILCVDSLEVQAFNEEHRKLLTVLGNQVIEAIEHTEIEHQMLSEMMEFAAFYEVSKKLTSTLNLSDVLSVTLDSAQKIAQFNPGAILFYNKEEKTFTIRSYLGENRDMFLNKSFKIEGSLTGYILQNYNKTYLIGDISQRKNLPPLFGPELPHIEFLSLLLIPLMIKGKNIGAMIFTSKKNHFFSIYEAEIFEVLGNQVAVAIENAKMYQQVESMAITDGLTKLYNHRKFHEIIDSEIKRAQRYNSYLTLLLMDIDFFKRINDTQGHPVGDEVLKKVAGIIKKFTREVDFACRYGGEEFALLLPNTSTREALIIAERIRKGVEKSTFIFSGEELNITLSTGIACFPADAKTKQELIDRADQSLYFAKNSGRNQTQTYEGMKNIRAV